MSDPRPAPRISVILPIGGVSPRVRECIESLRMQTLPPLEMVVVDNKPSGTDPALPSGVVYVPNAEVPCLAGNYNVGAARARGDFLLLTQEDCRPASSEMLAGLWKAMTPGCVAVCARVCLPEAVWRRMGFWGRVMMARWVGVVSLGISGKGDLVRRDVFLKIGGCDARHFQNNGDDTDLCLRLMREGRVEAGEETVIHAHAEGRELICGDVLRKCFMHAEGFGANLRRHGWRLVRVPYARRGFHHLNKAGYACLPLFLRWPWVALLVLLGISYVSLGRAWRIRSWQTLLLLGVAPVFWCASLLGTVRGFISGRSTLRL